MRDTNDREMRGQQSHGSDESDRASEDPEQSRPNRPASPPPPEANAPPPEEEVTPLRFTAHYASLVLSSMKGCLIRLGLIALGTYDGRVIYPIAWSQGVGCGIMGLALARKNEIVQWYPPLYTFWTTGESPHLDFLVHYVKGNELIRNDRCRWVRHYVFDLDGGGIHFVCQFQQLPERWAIRCM